jgi:methylenetetrahydrofolate dehydrogenase (NADP+)/methenyltetrahydrofolate cyclohydrolase
LNATPGARVIDDVAIAKKVRAEIATRVRALQGMGVIPALTVVLIGENPASVVYVRNKVRACRDVGIRSDVLRLSETVTEREVLCLIRDPNDNPSVHGILVQLPLPKHISLGAVLEAISIAKDVDGFHLFNVHGLVIGETIFPPCTPYGVQKILEYEGVP